MVLYWPANEWNTRSDRLSIPNTTGKIGLVKWFSSALEFHQFFGGAQIPKEQTDTSPFSQWSSWDGLDSAHRALLLSAGIKHMPKCKITQPILFLTEEIVKIQFKWHWKLLMLNNSISTGSNLLRCFRSWVGKDVVSNKV